MTHLKVRKSQSTVPQYWWTAFGIKKPETEYRYHPTRKWRFDYAWVHEKVAVEIEGGIWLRTAWGTAAGAHSRPQKILGDMERLNAAAALGWRVFRFSPQQLKKGEAQAFMMEVLK